MTLRGRSPLAALAVASALAALLGPAASLAAEEAPKSRLAELVGKMPSPGMNSGFRGPDRADAEKIYTEILQGGRDNVVALVDLVIPPGDKANFQPRYVLHGLAQYLAKPGLEKERRMFVDALGSTLGSARPKPVQGFVARQLQVVGDKGAAEPLGRLLLDDELCEYAAQALSAIGGEEAAAQLRKALPQAKGTARTTILRGLGETRDAKSVEPLRAALADPERDVRVTAGFALAMIGDPAAADPLLKAAEAEAIYERAELAAASLLLGRRLVEEGKTADAARLYKHLWQTRTGPEDLHVRCAAIQGMGAALDAETLDIVLAAAASAEPRIRAAAIDGATSAPGEAATRLLAGRLKGAPPQTQLCILTILDARGDPAARPAVLDALASADKGVRAAALAALGAVGKASDVPALAARLTKGEREEQDAARKSLLRLAGQGVNAALVAAMAGAEAGTRAELLRILGARSASETLATVLDCTRDPDATVRVAALDALRNLAGEKEAATVVGLLKAAKDDRERQAAEGALVAVCQRGREKCADVVVAALGGADPASRAALIRSLRWVGGAKALDAVVSATKDKDEVVQTEAVRTLAAWPDAAAIPPLLAIARAAAGANQQVLALRGCVQLADSQVQEADRKLALLAEAMTLAKRPDEKKMILGILGNVRTAESLKQVVPHLGDPALADEAGVAVVRIADSIWRQEPAAAEEAARKVLATAKSDRLKADATRVLERIQQEKERNKK